MTVDNHKLHNCLLSVAFAVIYGTLSYTVSYKLALITPSDLFIHATAVQDVWIKEGFLPFFYKVSYPGWHLIVFILLKLGIPLISAGCLASSFFSFLSALAVLYVSACILGKNHFYLAILISTITLFASSIFVPGFNPQPYYGQGSTTIWHNPTYTAVRPFAIASCAYLFFLFKYRRVNIKQCIIYALLTLICLFLKPSFFQIQLPALYVYLVIDFIKNRDSKFCLYLLLSTLPALLYLALQAQIMLFSPENRGEGFTIGFFECWRAVSPNFVISCLLLTAFPIFLLVVLRKELNQNASPYSFLLLLTVIGFCEASFLAEAGPRMMHGNFFWGFYLALFLDWVFLLPRFIKVGIIEKRFSRWIIAIGCVLLLCHFISGINYYVYLLIGNVPF